MNAVLLTSYSPLSCSLQESLLISEDSALPFPVPPSSGSFVSMYYGTESSVGVLSPSVLFVNLSVFPHQMVRELPGGGHGFWSIFPFLTFTSVPGMQEAGNKCSFSRLLNECSRNGHLKYGSCWNLFG